MNDLNPPELCHCRQLLIKFIRVGILGTQSDPPILCNQKDNIVLQNKNSILNVEMVDHMIHLLSIHVETGRLCDKILRIFACFFGVSRVRYVLIAAIFVQQSLVLEHSILCGCDRGRLGTR